MDEKDVKLQVKPVPETPKGNEPDKDVPEAKEMNKTVPDASKKKTKVPKAKELDKPVPDTVKAENVIDLDGEKREIFPTKLKYQRNRTISAYQFLDVYPVSQLLALDAGVLSESSGDQILFDFLVAVFDDEEFVKKHYDNMTTEDVENIVKIFKRVNMIEQKEEALKNRQAKTNR